MAACRRLQPLRFQRDEHTGKTIEQIEHDSDRDNYMTAEQSVAYGLVDKVLESRKQLPDAVSALVEAPKDDA